MSDKPSSGSISTFILVLIALFLAVRANIKINKIEANAPALLEESKP